MEGMHFHLAFSFVLKEKSNQQNTKHDILYYHPRRSARRAFGSEGSRSPKANIPASTPVKIDATAAHVETTIALPCFRPRVCRRREDSDYFKSLSPLKLNKFLSGFIWVNFPPWHASRV